MADSTVFQGLDLSSIGLAPTKAEAVANGQEARKKKTTLDQSDFMKLLVTQLQNQNPTDPQDNAQFVSQITQFGMLDGIKGLNDNFSTLSNSFTSNQALQASSIVGRSVLVPGNVAPYIKDEVFYGTTDLDQNVADLTIQISSESGQFIRRDFVGAIQKGSFPFVWDGTDAAGNAVPTGKYKISATATIDGKATELPMNLTYNVDSVSFAKGGKGMILNLAGGNQVSVDEVKEVR